jgi:hypothetical protein
MLEDWKFVSAGRQEIGGEGNRIGAQAGWFLRFTILL